MKQKKRYRLIFYYVRCSLVIWLFLVPFAITFFLILDSKLPPHIETLYFGLVLFCFPAFFILPGIIYEGKFKGAFHGITADQFKYSLFFGLTFGLGPLVLYFWKYDAPLRKYFKQFQQ